MQNRLSNFQAIHPAVRRGITAAIALFLLASPAMAQAKPIIPAAADTAGLLRPAASVAVAPDRGILDPASVSVAVPSWVTSLSVAPAATTGQASVAAAATRSTSHDAAMMIVGAAGILAGGVVGGKAGTAIMVGGTVVGLVGLWNYLK